ncbi:MAG: hypothetical protein WC028_09930 [Candidatus Obscuribacterales bacterium]|nr:hypothetical protein [bacterium]
MRVSSLILAAVVALSLAGCAVAPSVRVHPLTAAQPTVVDLDASARAIIMVPKPDGKGMAVCSEPSPDVAMSAVASMLAQVKLDNPNVDVQTKLDFQTAVIDLARRSQFVNFQRESLFRLCEQGMNQNLSSEQIFVLYQQVLQTSLKLAEAELAKNKADLAKALKDPAVRQLLNQLVDKPIEPMPLVGPKKK